MAKVTILAVTEDEQDWNVTIPLRPDNRNRSWHVGQREDGTISVYFTMPHINAHHVIWDSADQTSNLLPTPPPAQGQNTNTLLATAIRQTLVEKGADLGNVADLFIADVLNAHCYAPQQQADGRVIDHLVKLTDIAHRNTPHDGHGPDIGWALCWNEDCKRTRALIAELEGEK